MWGVCWWLRMRTDLHTFTPFWHTCLFFMQCYHCLKAQCFDLAQFLDSDALPLQGKVKKLDSQFTDCRSIPWRAFLFQPTAVMLIRITISCAVESCNHISPVFPVCISAVSAKTYDMRFQSRWRPYCARHKTKPCKTQSLSPAGWLLQRKADKNSEGNQGGGSLSVFWQVTGKWLNPVTSTLPLSDAVLHKAMPV